MSNHTEDKLCQQVEEQIASVIEGETAPTLLEHIAGCDRCRDLRHDAVRAVRALKEAGDDYRHPADFEAQLLGKLDERLQGGAEPSPALAIAVPVADGEGARTAQDGSWAAASEAAPAATLVDVALPATASGASDTESAQESEAAPAGDVGAGGCAPPVLARAEHRARREV
ncbi:MAG: hypothetical protein MUF54_19000 [Polyangiaceae bacterium]|nr:hypothetical protein [Polyangiaceae bacterium]